MTTIQKTTASATFAVGEKAWWVTPSGYKEVVTVTGRSLIGNTLTATTFYGAQIRFAERNGRYVGVEYWGHLAKAGGAVTPVVPAKSSLWTRIKKRFH